MRKGGFVRIVLLDDERIALAVLEKNVKKALPDAEVVSFRKSGEIIEYAQNNKIDIAFLDMNLPGITGIEIAEKLKTTDDSIKFVFCTGDIDCLSDSGYSVIPKPSSVSDISGILEKQSC